MVCQIKWSLLEYGLRFVGDTLKILNEAFYTIVTFEKDTPTSNRAEGAIQETNVAVRNKPKSSGSPIILCFIAWVEELSLKTYCLKTISKFKA